MLKMDPKAEPKEASQADKSALGTANSVEILTAIRANEQEDIERTDEDMMIQDPSAETLNNVGKQIIELHVPTDRTASQFMATAKKTLTSKNNKMDNLEV